MVIVTVLELKQLSPTFSLDTLLTSFVVNSKTIINILNKAITVYTLLPIVYNTARKQVTFSNHALCGASSGAYLHLCAGAQLVRTSSGGTQQNDIDLYVDGVHENLDHVVRDVAGNAELY